jgi:hypothetical protein
MDPLPARWLRYHDAGLFCGGHHLFFFFFLLAKLFGFNQFLA